ncbi:PREDICTED: uncharacterized protein LOC109226052 [Nicotiana attenuata]|uniref:uncharacterized protein LOC109226052 n=1 Tax=Nicotiana attenuata TaxID=49451 RepID=UPI000905ACF4|nr:PREDICTED: uncharacterized protein LOC109226052 [Nicotiana attenuata]
MVIKGFKSSDRFASDRRADRSQSNRSLQEKEAPGSQDPTYPRLSDYNFTIILVELVSVMRSIKEARFPNPIQSDPSKRDPNLWCEFHGTHGHRTGDCRHLREEVATLLKNGHLREFLSNHAKNNCGRNRDNAEQSKSAAGSPRMTINMIFEGNKINGVTFSAAKKTKISVAHVFKIKRVLVDPGSSANIVQWRVLEQAMLIGNVIPATKLLAGFDLASVTTRGEILLPTHIEGVTKTTFFEVVDDDMGYNVILERQWIHEMKVVPLTYHQLLKFSTPYGIKQMKGDQPVGRRDERINRF